MSVPASPLPDLLSLPSLPSFIHFYPSSFPSSLSSPSPSIRPLPSPPLLLPSASSSIPSLYPSSCLSSSPSPWFPSPSISSRSFKSSTLHPLIPTPHPLLPPHVLKSKQESPSSWPPSSTKTTTTLQQRRIPSRRPYIRHPKPPQVRTFTTRG